MTVKARGTSSKVLIWARERAGLSVDDVADGIGRPVEVIQSWESGEDVPTFNQLEKLAALTKRPVAIFFFPEPPPDEDMRREFRTLPNSELEKFSSDTLFALREARAFQLSLADLTDGENPAQRRITADLRAPTDADPAALAVAVREYLGLDVEEQSAWRKQEDAFKAWRDVVEGAGVFVFKRPFEQTFISGFCLDDPTFPVILINNSTAHSRQTFTLFHELGHLLYGVSSITTSDIRFESRLPRQARELEIRCNKFAAEFLLPTDAFPWSAFEAGSLEDAVADVADRFKVSREVVLRRLLDAGLVESDEYETLASQWIAEAQDARSSGGTGGNYYANQVTYLGNAFLRLGFDNFHAGRITLPDLADHFRMRAGTVERLDAYVAERESV